MAEAVTVPAQFNREKGRRIRNNEAASSESQDESSGQRRQREAMRLKYSQRRRRFRKKKVEKTQASSSDSESNSERKSVELINLHKQPFDDRHWIQEREFLAKPTFVDECSLCESMLIAESTGDLWDDMGSFHSHIKPKTTNWYSELFGSIFGSLSHVANYIFSNKMSLIAEKENFDPLFSQDFEGNTEEMTEKVLDRVMQFCPQEYEEELQIRCIQPLRHKLNQRGVTIGICGKSQSMKKAMMKLIERRAFDIGNVSYRLCLNPSKESFEDTCNTMPDSEWKQNSFDSMSELSTCAAYIYVLSGDRELGYTNNSDSMDSLQWLFEKDRDVVTQGRLLLLVNRFNANLTHSSSSPLTCLEPNLPNITQSTSPDVIQSTNPNVTQSTSPQSTSYTSHYRTQSPNSLTSLMQTYIHEKVGIHIPRNYILSCALKTKQTGSKTRHKDKVVLAEGLCEQSEVAVDLSNQRTEDEPQSSSEDEMIESFKNEVVEIEEWLKQSSQNCEAIRQLSIISDALYCVQYCCDRLQIKLEDNSRDIDKHEGLLAHQNHLMMEMKRLWTHLEVKTKDIDLYNEMTLSYEQDIKDSVKTVRDCAHNVLERFQAVCVSKLEKLTQTHEHTKFHIRDILHLFKLEIDSFTSEIVNCVNMVNSNLLFLNMQHTLQQRCNYSELQEVQELAQACLMTGLTNEANISYMPQFEYGKMLSPCTLETMGCRTNLNPAQISNSLCSVLMILASKLVSSCNEEDVVRSDLRKLRNDFKELCSSYLQSGAVRQKVLQYHMEMISSLFYKHLDAFKQFFLPQFKDNNHQLECRLADIKSEYRTLELHFKHLINLKVHLEVKKSSYFLHSE